MAPTTHMVLNVNVVNCMVKTLTVPLCVNSLIDQLSFDLLPAQSWSREEGAANLKLLGDYRK